ncbi:MAG TPA: hypothetical protein VFE50_16915 [Cyclobacteriaceae bacterium]|nr:hypothetical protein [Cyclobacteriaceae bacterium]
MTTSDWITIISIVVSTFVATIVMLVRFSKTLRIITTKIDWIFAELKKHSEAFDRIEMRLSKHDKRVRRVEKSIAKLHRAPYKP